MTGFETYSYDNPDVLAPQIRARYEYLEVRSACAIMRAVSPDEWQDITEFSQVALRGTTTIPSAGHVLLSHYLWAEHMNGSKRADLSTNALDTHYKRLTPSIGFYNLLLHGHTHATIPDEFNDPRQINIGLDAWELKPVNETSIISLLVSNGEYAKRTGWGNTNLLQEVRLNVAKTPIATFKPSSVATRKHATWWALDQMLADERMRAVNGDLIGTLELIEVGLLPAPSVAG